MESGRELLKVDGVSKAFPGILANDTITFDLKEGEIHALLGENGAGKTTLVGILFGLLRPDAGRVLVDGKELESGNPREAIVPRTSRACHGSRRLGRTRFSPWAGPPPRSLNRSRRTVGREVEVLRQLSKRVGGLRCSRVHPGVRPRSPHAVAETRFAATRRSWRG